MWLPNVWIIKAHLYGQGRDVFWRYLLNIILSTIIKANAIIVTTTKAENSIIINCKYIFSIISTTSILCRWQPHSASPNFDFIIYARI